MTIASKYFYTIYEDSDILVVDKPAGLIVESQKESDLTLEKILKKKLGIKLPRSGIVHRLDRDTSGLMVVAKNAKSLVSLQNQFASHKVKKIYYALVFGKIEPKNGTIKISLKRDPKNRIRFIASMAKDAKDAVTKYKVLKNFEIKKQQTSFLEIQLLTGRTHQIRAHFFAIGYPILGDQVYKTRDSEVFSRSLNLDRQFLHAGELSFTHPGNKKIVDFKSDLPDNLSNITDQSIAN